MSISILHATDQYLESLREKGKSERTLITYGIDLQTVCRFFGNEQPLDKVTPLSVGKFLKSDLLHCNARTGESRSMITINKNVRVMRQFFLWATNEGHIDTLPLPKSVPLGRQSKATAEEQR